MSSSSLQYLCRFCAKTQTRQNVIDLRNSGSSPHRSVRDMLCIFSEEIIDFSNSNLSAIICNECFSSLNMCYNFFVQVRQSQLLLSRSGYGTEDDLDIGPVKVENNLISHDDTIEIDVIEELSWSSYEWCCRHCSAIWPSLQDLREHGLKTHGTCFVFHCRDCDETTAGFEEFVDHVRGHHPHLRDYCQYCNAKMETPTHIDDTHNNFYCTYCGQEFANIILLQAHVQKYIDKTNKCTNTPTETSHREITIDKTVTTYSEELITPDIDIIKDESQENYTSVKNEISDNDANDITNMSLENIDESNDYGDDLLFDNAEMFDRDITLNANCHQIDPLQRCDYPFVCKFCGIAVESENTLMLHCRYTHKKSFARKSVDCEDTDYTTLESFVQHVGEHRPNLLLETDKKKLIYDHEMTEKDSIESTPNKSEIEIDQNLIEQQKEAKKPKIPSKNNTSIIDPLITVHEVSVPSSELPVLDEPPDNKKYPTLQPTRKQSLGETSKPSRKRKSQPNKWKRNISKVKREKGEEYFDAKGKCIPAKTVKSGCENNCRLKCSMNFSSDLREKIKSDFYSLTDAQKYIFYGKYTEKTVKSTTRTKKESSRRSNTFHYYLYKGTEIVKVCRTFFCSTLSISARRIHYFYLKMEKSESMLPLPTPARSEVKNETPIEKINEVVDHIIELFPTVASHYCRVSSMRQYLESGLNIGKMYSLYVKTSKDPVTENIYRKVFSERFNLGFHDQKKSM